MQVSGVGGAALGGPAAVGGAAGPAAANATSTAAETTSTNQPPAPLELPSDTSVAEGLMENSAAVAESMSEFFESFDLMSLLLLMLLSGGGEDDEEKSSGSGLLLGLVAGMALANQMHGMSGGAEGGGVPGIESAGGATGGAIDVYA